MEVEYFFRKENWRGKTRLIMMVDNGDKYMHRNIAELLVLFG